MNPSDKKIKHPGHGTVATVNLQIMLFCKLEELYCKRSVLSKPD